MTFPLYYFLFFYGFFIFIWGIFSLIAVYHMFRYGFKNFFTFFAVFLYIAASIGLFYTSLAYINGIDWQLNVTMFENFKF
jgi:hypothetical protein